MKKLTSLLTAILLFSSLSGQNIKLHFNSEGKFKIVQFTDIHHNPDSKRVQEVTIEEILNRVLDAEKPDLVVFTGDIITGKPQQREWDRVLKPVIDRKIPYVVTLGNHDDEYDWTREQIGAYLEKKQYSLFQRGPKDIRGEGNFVLEVAGNKGKAAALLYFMDSNAYNEINGQKGWDWFDFNQVDWYRKTSRAQTKKNQGKPYPALAFFHIPLQEYRLLFDTLTINYFNRVKPLPLFGEHKERVCSGIINTGMFAAIVESGDVMGTFVGHDHSNNYIGCLDGIALAYGLFTGGNTLKRGGRVIELKENQRSFDTWLRRADGEILYKLTYPDAFNNH